MVVSIKSRSYLRAVLLATVAGTACYGGQASTDSGADGKPDDGDVGDTDGDDDDGDVDGDDDDDSSPGGSSVGGSEGETGDPSTEETQTFSRPGLAARLSKLEYRNSIFDVLGVTLLPEELDAASGGLVDDTGDGVFKHLADNQTSVEQHALSYFQVAEQVAKRVDIPALMNREGTCRETTSRCGSAILEALGRRLYRRPLQDRELATILTIYDDALAEDLDDIEATRWAIMGLLQMPQFLFRMAEETFGVPGEARDLDGYELAAQLASFLWVSVPDDALLSAAANDLLLEPEVLAQEVERMLADPKAQRLTEVFAMDFSRARFASYEGSTDADRAALNESVVATFQDHFWTQEKSVADLFLTTRFMVNPTVADILGIEVAGEGLEAVDVSGLPQRIGLMSHPAMIAGMGDREIGSFVNRGKYLMERLLCRHPVAFPESITSEIEEFNTDTTGLSEHERAALRMGRVECWSCHRQFEPLAFGFSRFDGAGRYLGEQDADGKPLPLDGFVPTGGVVESHYDDVQSYMQILATDPIVQNCTTEHFINFATSRIGDSLGRAQAALVREVYQANGSTLAAMVSAVSQSELFRTIVTASEGS